MGAADQAAQLREQAALLDRLAGLEAAVLTTKQAYRDHPDSASRDARDQAADMLRAARQEQRESGLKVLPGDGASVSVTPAPIRGKAN